MYFFFGSKEKRYQKRNKHSGRHAPSVEVFVYLGKMTLMLLETTTPQTPFFPEIKKEASLFPFTTSAHTAFADIPDFCCRFVPHA